MGALSGLVFGGASAVRRGKAVHPHGVVYAAELEVSGAPDAPQSASLLREPGGHPAIVRFSRSLGVPRPLPDLLGMSIRVPDAYGPAQHQDFLLVSSVDLPVAHHVFLPVTDAQQRPYSSSLPYRAGPDLFIVGTLPDPGSPRPAGEDEFDRLDAAAATGRLRFGLAVASLGGRFRTLATLRIGDRLGGELDALRFNPQNTGGGLEPAGFLNRIRPRTYSMSQAGWRRTRSDGASAQDRAEAALAEWSALRPVNPRARGRAGRL